MPAADPGQLRWRCRRGMRELDVLVTRYLDERYPSAGEAEQAAFVRLLELPDPELLAYVTGRASPDDPELARVVAAVSAPA